MISLLAALLAFSPAASAKYDTGEDRAALLKHANAAYAAADTAAGTPLEPAKAPGIKANVDQSVAEAGLAENYAKSLESSGATRAGEMENELKGRDDASRNQAGAALALRNRWKKLTADQTDLKTKVDALPDTKPDGKHNDDKSSMRDTLDKAAGFLNGADGNITPAENGAAAMISSLDSMKSIQHRSQGPAGERKNADSEVVSSADSLPPPAAEAKAAVDQVGQEPQAENRTRAGAKLGAVRDIAGRLLSAADRAGHRDEDFVSLSNAFDRTLGTYEEARKASDGKTDAAKPLLDQAEAAQNDVRSRLAHN